MTMVTSNIIQRTFRLRGPQLSGTGFTIERDSREYLITAHHVVEGISSGETIQILRNDVWKDLVVQVVGLGKEGADVAVLASPIQLSPRLPTISSSKHLIYGQQVFFLGYPYGWDSGNEQINRGVPIPFVKAGIISAMITGNVSLFVLDAHGNKGFSGGPVVFSRSGERELRVAGIVSRGPRVEYPIEDSEGNSVASVRENTGFVVAIDIKHALDLIDANPIGFRLPANEDLQEQ